jgi:RHS repeat-associated protein
MIDLTATPSTNDRRLGRSIPLRFSSYGGQETHGGERRVQQPGLRFYSSPLGRWVNRDPIEEGGGIMLLAFTRNNPIGYVDALGRAVLMSMQAMAGPIRLVKNSSRTVLIFGNPGASRPGVFYGTTSCLEQSGELHFVQLINSRRTITFRDGSKIVVETAGYWLDNKDPYTRPSWFIGAQLFAPKDANDSPLWGVPSSVSWYVKSMFVHDRFKLFLMFKPTFGTRYTIGRAHWSWVAKADRFGSQGLILGPTVANVNDGHPVSEMPAYSSVYSNKGNDVKIVRPSSIPPGESFADDLAHLWSRR